MVVCFTGEGQAVWSVGLATDAASWHWQREGQARWARPESPAVPGDTLEWTSTLSDIPDTPPPGAASFVFYVLVKQ